MDKFRVRNYLEENLDVAVDVAREINGWDGSFSFVDTWDITEIVQCYCGDYESTKSFLDIMLNSLDTLPRDVDTPVRFSEYGEYLEAADDDTVQEEIKDYIDEIVEEIEQRYPSNIDIYDNELKELVEADFDVEYTFAYLWEEAERHYKSSEITVDVLEKLIYNNLDMDEAEEEQLLERLKNDPELN